MDFRAPPGRKLDDNLLPMINVVFLLLIFFLITARLTAPEPFAITPPEARVEVSTDGRFTLFLSAEGQMASAEAAEEAALLALVEARAAHCAQADCEATPPSLTLRADARLEAARLASILPRLGGLGFARIELVATGPGEAGP